MRQRWLIGSTFLACFVVASTAIACKLPVFRYALERWSADRYRVVAMIDGHSETVDQALAELERLEKSNANVEVETIDISKLTEDQIWQIEELEEESNLPALQVFYPARDGRRRLCWSGSLSAESVQLWRQSELRDQIIQDIVSGVSAVWILREGIDADENDRIASELEAALRQATEQIKIPEGVIAQSDATELLSQDPSASMEDVLRSDIPLKIDFRVHRLARENPRELALRSIVDGWGQESDADKAIVFPVFGRGRMIEPLSADAFSAESVIAACQYMVGQCSCTLKTLNPGVDLVLDADWQSHMDETVLVIDPSTAEQSSEPELVEIPPGRDDVTADSDSRRRGWWVAALLGTIVAIGVAWRLWPTG